MIEWAKKEVKLACKKENPDWDGKSFDYGCTCYQSALEAYEVLSKQGHSGFSWAATRDILMRLMNNQPLTPIEDTEDVWIHIAVTTDGDIYQCTRMSSLFMTAHHDGQITYSDNDRQFGITDGKEDIPFGSGIATRCVNALFPITMPYMPENNKYKVLFHKNDDYPYAVVKPDGKKVYVKCKNTFDGTVEYSIIKEDNE